MFTSIVNNCIYIFIFIYIHDASSPVFSHHSLIFSQKVLMFSQKRHIYLHAIALYPYILFPHKSPVFSQQDSYLLTNETGVFSHGKPVPSNLFSQQNPRIPGHSYSVDQNTGRRAH